MSNVIHALRSELPAALRHLRHDNVATVDFPQVVIDLVIATFSRYSPVLEDNGEPTWRRTALQLINLALEEVAHHASPEPG